MQKTLNQCSSLVRNLSKHRSLLAKLGYKLKNSKEVTSLLNYLKTEGVISYTSIQNNGKTISFFVRCNSDAEYTVKYYKIFHFLTKKQVIAKDLTKSNYKHFSSVLFSNSNRKIAKYGVAVVKIK